LVGDSVVASVGDSVGDSVEAYIGSFFKLPRAAWKHTENVPGDDYPFRPVVSLWKDGLVPSFDGKIWRLHGGEKAEILWKGKLPDPCPCSGRREAAVDDENS
jgi:putative lipase involved disintegration of autophagic bodies